MGFLSSIAKGVKNIFKGVVKVVKKVVKGVKKFASSKLGKALIIGAAIYFGGAYLANAGAGASSTAATQLASSTIPTAAAGTAATAAELGTLASTGLTSASAGSLATGMGNLAVTGAGAGTAAGSTGLMSQIAAGAKAAGGWAAANPELAIAGGQVASSMFAPSQAQTAEELERVRQQNSNIAGVNYDGSGSPINLSLSQRAQQGDLKAPTYNTSYVPGGG
jgi:hypothetical protein